VFDERIFIVSTSIPEGTLTLDLKCDDSVNEFMLTLTEDGEKGQPKKSEYTFTVAVGNTVAVGKFITPVPEPDCVSQSLYKQLKACLDEYKPSGRPESQKETNKKYIELLKPKGLTIANDIVEYKYPTKNKTSNVDEKPQ
jgi:hypothetical protein